MKLRTRGAVGLIGTVILLALFVLWGTMFVGPDGRESSQRASAILSILTQYQTVVDEHVRAHGKLDGAGATINIKVVPQGVLGRAFVSDRATMVGIDSKKEVVVVLEPILDGQAIRWECSVIPPKASPALCGTK